jgi:hypothetical protein
MAAHQYELLKCEDCGKTLGYIYILNKMRLSGLLAARFWLQGQPTSEIEKTALCESCFKERVDETLKGQSEPKNKKDRTVEPQAKSKDRSLIR